MKPLTYHNYVDRVHKKLSKEHPHLTKNTVKRVLSIYTRNVVSVLFRMKTVHINGWLKIQPVFRDLYLHIKKYRQNE